MRAIKVLLLLIVVFILSQTIVVSAAYSDELWDVRKLYGSSKVFNDQNDNSKKMPYRFYNSTAYGLSKTYPLVVYLHDDFGKGNDNHSQLTEDCIANLLTLEENKSKFPCYILVPQCPANKEWVYGNLDTSFYSQKISAVSQELTMVMEIIHELKQQYPIDSGRIYVGGLGSGASAAWDLCTRYPEMFAAAFPVAGRTDPTVAEKMKNIPVWSFHAVDDAEVPANATGEMIIELKNLGGNALYTEYRNGGHNICSDKVYKENEFLYWLFSRRKKSENFDINIKDVDISNPYYKNIQYIVKSNIMPLSSEGHFSPDEHVTVEQVVHVMLEASGYHYNNFIKDNTSPRDAYSTIAQRIRLDVGVYKSLDSFIDRESLAYMVGSHFNSNDQSDMFTYISTFEDRDKINEKFYLGVLKACELGIINIFDDGEFKPELKVTKGELAEIIHRMLEQSYRIPATDIIKEYSHANSEVIWNNTVNISAFRRIDQDVFFNTDGMFVSNNMNFGNVISDAIRYNTGADVGIVSIDEMKGNILRGQVTVKEIFDFIPSRSPVLLLEIKGEDLYSFLNDLLSQGILPSMSGIKFTYKIPNEPNERIIYPRIGVKDLESDTNYTLAINESIVNIGGNDIIAKLKILKKFSNSAQLTVKYIKTFGVNYGNMQTSRILVRTR